MSKFQIPKNFYHLTSSKVALTKKNLPSNFSTLFSNPNNEYVLDLVGPANWWITPEKFFFKTLNITGAVTINCKDIDHFSCPLNDSWCPSVGRVVDWFKGKSITINNPNGHLDFMYDSWNAQTSTDSHLEEINLNAKKYWVKIEGAQTLKKLKIQFDNSDKALDSRINLINLQHLQSLDLSSFEKIPHENLLHLSVINPDCVLTINPKLKIVNEDVSITNEKTNKDEYFVFWNDLNHIFNLPLHTKASQASFKDSFSFAKALNIKDLNKPYKIKYSDLRKKLDEYCIKVVEQKNQLVR